MSDIKDQYTFVTDKKENWQCIGINGGRYQGVIYKYGKVTIPEPPEENYEGDLPLKFEYDNFEEWIQSNREVLGVRKFL